MKPLTPRMIEVLTALSAKGEFVHYQRAIVNWIPNASYFLHNGSSRKITAQVLGLLARGLCERFNVNCYGDHKVRISKAGRSYLKEMS